MNAKIGKRLVWRLAPGERYIGKDQVYEVCNMGYAVGALISGIIADLLGMRVAIQVVAVLTLISGLQVALRMRETHVARPAEPLGTPVATK